jgi:hypothetical protein
VRGGGSSRRPRTHPTMSAVLVSSEKSIDQTDCRSSDGTLNREATPPCPQFSTGNRTHGPRYNGAFAALPAVSSYSTSERRHSSVSVGRTHPTVSAVLGGVLGRTADTVVSAVASRQLSIEYATEKPRSGP